MTDVRTVVSPTVVDPIPTAATSVQHPANIELELKVKTLEQENARLTDLVKNAPPPSSAPGLTLEVPMANRAK